MKHTKGCLSFVPVPAIFEFGSWEQAVGARSVGGVRKSEVPIQIEDKRPVDTQNFLYQRL